MRRLLLLIGIGLLLFSLGTIAGARWNARRSLSQVPVPTARKVEENEWPLTREVVTRSLQSHSFRTDKLRRNSDEEIVWRWLKESIAKYPQNWVKLNISDKDSYGIVIYPQKVLEPTMLASCNQELSKKGLPKLNEGKRYLPINVYQGNIICPSWSGIIDVEEAKLVYFVGESG